ncbi:MAG: hypothetical protein RIR95_1555 [Pseudomonadota bacterium]
MMLTEQTQIATAALPVQLFKDHLRLGSGFADVALQDNLLQAYLRSAIAAIEKRIGKVILARRFMLTLEDWRHRNAQSLPVAPVTAIVSVALRDAANVQTLLDANTYRLVQDTHRPKVASSGILFASPVEGGRIEVVFDAGFGVTWDLVPPDLAQAVLLLAAEYYEDRHHNELTQNGVPPVVQNLFERWRGVRVVGGGEA